MLPELASNPPQHHPQQRPQNGQIPQMNGILPQHDGADDDAIPIEGYRTISREEADRILLRRIGAAERESAKATEELANALRGLKTTSPPSSSKSFKKRRRPKRQDAYEAALDGTNPYPYPSTTTLSSSANATTPRISQLDGESDDEVADEDAINSDLDDPEEDEIDNEDEDEVPQIMLCMYDKVQRTKNKWKCVLKDGVLTINGKEWVLLSLFLVECGLLIGYADTFSIRQMGSMNGNLRLGHTSLGDTSKAKGNL